MLSCAFHLHCQDLPQASQKALKPKVAHVGMKWQSMHFMVWTRQCIRRLLRSISQRAAEADKAPALLNYTQGHSLLLRQSCRPKFACY